MQKCKGGCWPLAINRLEDGNMYIHGLLSPWKYTV